MNIELRKWTKEDRKILMKICNEVNRKYLSNRIPLPYRETDAEWWINYAINEELKTGIFRAIVVDGEVVGNISIERKDDIRCKDSEIGYIVLNEKFNRGIATEATKQIVKIAFNNLDIIRITGLVCEENMASRKVLEKNNFILEGNMKNAMYKDGESYNMCIYGLCKKI
ncbi:MAG: GNAT family N-acetyltransferase [Clostridium sp.]